MLYAIILAMRPKQNAKNITPENMSILTDKLEAVRERRRLARRSRYRRSKLDRYRAELVALRRMGASYKDLSLYIWHEHRRRADPTTIRRYLVKLPEISAQEADSAGIPNAC